MQRRLIDDLVELELYTEKISEASTKCKQLLDKLLSAHDKSFEVVVDGELFDFDVAFTQEEHIELSEKRRQLIDKIMILSMKHDDWSYVTAFADGIDPIDMQCEIIKNEDVYPVLDENGEKVVALPLNEDAHVVKVQRLKDEDVKDNQGLVQEKIYID
jgi:hypothetical protein